MVAEYGSVTAMAEQEIEFDWVGSQQGAGTDAQGLELELAADFEDRDHDGYAQLTVRQADRDMRRWARDLEREPQVVVLALGQHDLLEGQEPAQVSRAIASLARDAQRAGDDAARAEAERLFEQETKLISEDLARYKPRAVIVEVGEDKPYLADEFQFLPFYLASDQFRAQWAHYELADRLDHWEIYRRRP